MLRASGSLCFSGDEVHVIRSHFEEEIEKVPQIEEINKIIASEEKMSS